MMVTREYTIMYLRTIIHFKPESNDGCRFRSQRNITNDYMILGKSSLFFCDGNFLAQTTPCDVTEYHSGIHLCTGNRESSEPRCPEQEIFQGV